MDPDIVGSAVMSVTSIYGRACYMSMVCSDIIALYRFINGSIMSKSIGGSKPKEQAPDAGGVTYRAGVAARLAGLSAETLRVWERRYGVSDTRRTARGHRLYTAEQVRRLGMLKQLVDQGHAIGVLVGLSNAELQELVAGPRTSAPANAPIKTAVISAGLYRRIVSSGSQGSEIAVQATCSKLEEWPSLPTDAGVEVLLAELSELDESVIPDILAAQKLCGAVAVLVLYRFCSMATIRALRAQGCFAARVPAEIGELAVLCRSALAGERLPASPQPDAPPLRFNEETLSSITARGSGIVCECPRHLADLLMMVGSFERYSAQCASKNEQDAHLHKELERAAGHARAILEVAMGRLADAEGLWGA